MKIENVLTANIHQLVKLYGDALNLSPGSISLLALKDYYWLQKVLDQGNGFSVRTYDRFVAYLAKTWPPNLEWPKNIPRPTRADIESLEKPVKTKREKLT